MSAETTPADVIELVAKTIHDHWQGAPGLSARPWDGEKGTCTKLPAQAEDFRRKARAVMEALATRPAEPSAPVAEAGDGEVYLADACKPWEFATGPVPAYDSPLHQVFVAGMLYTEQLLANHLGVKRYEAGDGSEDFDNDATMSLVNILTEAGLWDKDEWRSTLEAERVRADAAEQRAAEALARAEKAEGEIVETRDLLWRIKDFGGRWTAKTPFGSYFIDASEEPCEWAFGSGDYKLVGSLEDAKAAAQADFKARARSCLLPSRASREAQPATDGGDNG